MIFGFTNGWERALGEIGYTLNHPEGTTGFVPQEKDKMAVDGGYFFSVVRGTIGDKD